MKRREFFNISLPATGAILAAPDWLSGKVFDEINRQFLGKGDFTTYDVVINGAGMAGYFAALAAAEKGQKVLIVDKRTSPGFDLAAKKKLWLHKDGIAKLSAEQQQLFFPEGEREEIQNKAVSGAFQSQIGDELSLFSGSIRKGMLRNLLLAQVDVLLMTDVCGIFSDEKQLSGLLLAGKHGIHAVNCRHFIDASDNLLFSRSIAGQDYEIEKAGFVLELFYTEQTEAKTLAVPKAVGVLGDQVKLHPGKRSDHQMFLEFEFKVDSQHLSAIEQQARWVAASLGENLSKIDPALAKAKIHQFALETSLYLKDDALPKMALANYHLLPTPATALDGNALISLEKTANALVQRLKASTAKVNTDQLVLQAGGSKIPMGQWKMEPISEPGLAVPLQNCAFDVSRFVTNKEDCQVLVAGAGTAGAMAGLGAAEKGANTIIVDYFNDLGGTKTMGGVMGYYHGVKDHKFFKEQVDEAESLAAAKNMVPKIGRKLYHLQSIQQYDSRVIGGAIICGAIVEDATVKGIVVCRDGQLELIRGTITIDGTGDGDVAYFAGANYKFGDPRYGQTQNYSQWDINGGGKLPSTTNRDYDIIDNTKISELQRGLFLSHYEAHFYDFHPMLTVRESRRIEGLYELNVIDAAEKNHFQDVIAHASSDYDPHNVGTTPYSRCGFLLPHSNDLVMEVPYRCIVPKGLDGLLLAGRGYSQTHNALQFTRMTADLIVLGYKTGQIAADQAWNGIAPKDYDISGLQKEWASLGYLPADYAAPETTGLRFKKEEIARRVAGLAEGKQEFLYECIRLPKEKALPVLKETYQKQESVEGKLLLAKAIAWFGDSEGSELIEAELNGLFAREQLDGYPGGYVDNYDFIRGREKNVLEGLFWRINQNIALLATAGYAASRDTIRHILENTVSGGGMVDRTSDYYNGRIDLKIIPFHNRIFNLCFYIDRLPDPMFAVPLQQLLKDEHIGGFKTESYDAVRWKVFGASLELAIAASLARCGAKEGYAMLVDYLGDIHHIFKKFAASELNSLTGSDLAFDASGWQTYLERQSFPRPAVKLEKMGEA
jgi:ribulose 1,5-bisphosphate synthetase/thiazole synthase